MGIPADDAQPANSIKVKPSPLPSIHVLMSRVMADVGAIGKNSRNTQQNFVFRGIDDVMNAVNGALCKHGVFYAPEVLNAEYFNYTTKNGTGMRSATLDVAYTFYGPAGDSVQTVFKGEASDSGDKATNKALAAALKYCLLHTFCIPTEEQARDDADRHSPEVSDGVSAPQSGGPNGESPAAGSPVAAVPSEKSPAVEGTGTGVPRSLDQDPLIHLNDYTWDRVKPIAWAVVRERPGETIPTKREKLADLSDECLAEIARRLDLEEAGRG